MEVVSQYAGPDGPSPPSHSPTSARHSEEAKPARPSPAPVTCSSCFPESLDEVEGDVARHATGCWAWTGKASCRGSGGSRAAKVRLGTLRSECGPPFNAAAPQHLPKRISDYCPFDNLGSLNCVYRAEALVSLSASHSNSIDQSNIQTKCHFNQAFSQSITR